MTWALADQWQMSPQVTYLANISSIDINTYHQTIIYLTLRRDF